MSTDVYLEPRPADYDLDPQLKSKNGPAKPIRYQNAQDQKAKFDSGFADLEMHRMSAASARPKSSAMYEYIDSGGHYEDVPGTLGRSVSGLPNGGPNGRQSTVSDSRSVVTDVTSDTDDTATIFKTPIDKRKRYNPLYEANTASAPNLFAQNKRQQHLQKLERHIRVQCAFLLIISVVAVAALCLSLYLIFFQVLDQNNSMTARIEKMEQRGKELTEENEELKLIITAAGFNTSLVSSPLIKTLSNTSEAVVTFEEELDTLTSKVTFTQQNLTQELADLKTNFYQQLLNFSKMPGPQGPPGVGNLSSCVYQNYSSTIVADNSASSTDLLPRLDVLQTKIVMSAACGIEGGTSYTLGTNVISPNMVQYRCICRGQTLGESDRTCIIHLVLCPRVT